MSIKSFTKNVANIGPVFFERSKKAKNVNISIKPFKGIRVAVPFGMSYQMAEELVKRKKKWINENLKKVNDIENEHKTKEWVRPVIDKKKAREILVSRLKDLANKNGFSYNRVFIRNQKTRWGSCSGKNNINLNTRLLELPDELVDYVILHELVHLKIKSHGSKFWAELDKFVGNAKKVDKELKKYRLAV